MLCHLRYWQNMKQVLLMTSYICVLVKQLSVSPTFSYWGNMAHQNVKFSLLPSLLSFFMFQLTQHHLPISWHPLVLRRTCHSTFLVCQAKFEVVMLNYLHGIKALSPYIHSELGHLFSRYN